MRRPPCCLYHLSASVIAVIQLTGSVISTCYDHQLRGARNASMDLKVTIDYLRSLNDVLHHLYTVVDCDDPDRASPLSWILNLFNTADDPLMQCTTELHSLERILAPGNRPVNGAELRNTLDSLRRIQGVLDANNWPALDSQSNVSTEPTGTSLSRVMQGGINDMRASAH